MTRMSSPSARLAGALTVVSCLAWHASILAAQGIEVTPVTGYRFGDPDGARALGVVLDVPLSDGLQIEGLFTHQHAHADQRVSTDQWQAGGLQEFRGGRLRPFLTGTLGLTRYAADASREVRFNLAAGGGVKLFASPHIGLRLDSRVFTTILDVDGHLVACSTGSCLLFTRVDVAWQMEFTAGLVVKFP